jgi:hypothetical protein
MQALAEYRNPKKRSFTAIRQANIAEQQVVNSIGARDDSGKAEEAEIRAESAGAGGAAEKRLPG